jgi:hypothetical protein
MSVPTVTFQEALEIVDALPEEQQEHLIEIVKRRQTERRREQLARGVKAARVELRRGEAKRGSVDDLMKDLNERGVDKSEDDIFLIEIGTHDEVY